MFWGQIFLQIVSPCLSGVMSLFARVYFFVYHLSDIYVHAHLRIHMEETRRGEGGLLQCGLFNTSAKERQMAVSSPLKRFQEEVQGVKVCCAGSGHKYFRQECLTVVSMKGVSALSSFERVC